MTDEEKRDMAALDARAGTARTDAGLTAADMARLHGTRRELIQHRS